MKIFSSANNFLTLITGAAFLAIGFPSIATAQTFTATRLGNNPIISTDTFDDAGASGGDNINGASVIRIPNWIPASERVDLDAKYYMYFSNHAGDDIRLAWSASVTGPWSLFNAEGGSSPSRTEGSNTQTPGNGVFDIDLGGGTARPFESSDVGVFNHVASPDVHIDDRNERIIMYFHGEQRNPVTPFVQNQKTFVATSKYGLNFNPEQNGGEDGFGMREVVLGESYFRTFEVRGQTFAYSNNAELWKAPSRNDREETNTLNNPGHEGGWWNPSSSHNVRAHWWNQRSQNDNPIEQLYRSLNEGVDDPRHFAIYTRSHVNPDDTNIYVFYTSKDDAPERILLTVIDTNNSTNPGNWSALGQETILEPELNWEGGNLRNVRSESGDANNVRQLRDPYIFEDDNGTSSTADDELYIFYSGGGEDAIGVARLNPVVNITKRSGLGFSLDGGRGADDGQNVYLWGANKNNVNQRWIEHARGNGFYSYQKVGTNHCIDGGRGGSRGQNVYIWECNSSNRNQHWQKRDSGSGFFQLRKRNSTGFAINGGSGGEDGQDVGLYDSSSTSQNLQWRIEGIH